MAGEIDEFADSILFGQVVTLDGNGTVAEAVAIKGGRILEVGARKDVMRLGTGRTEVHDFATAAIVPGFNDSHAHMDTEGLKLMRPSLAGARSLADVVARITDLATKTPPGCWIVTMPVGDPPHYFAGPAALAEGRMPVREELDRAAPDHPVCILPPSGYWGKPPCYMALNSLALKLNGIDRATMPRLAGIEILKDQVGEPTGVFVDHNPRESAQLDLMPEVPKFSHEDRRKGVREAMKLYHSKGTTSIYEGHGCSPEVMRIYQDLWNAGELTMRVGMVINPPWSSVADAETTMRDWLGHARGRGLGDPMLRVSGVHIAYGGDPLAAQLAREQANDTGYWSFHWHAFTPTEFEELCMLAAKYDLRVHTIASAGKQREIIPILERVDSQYNIRSRRWVIEHMSLSGMDDLRALKALGVGVTLIPLHHLWKNGAAFFDLGEAESELVAPAKQLRDLGVAVAAGTDNTPYDPLAVIYAMTCREERTTNRVIGEAGKVTAEAALEALTWAGAWFTFEEDSKGRLVAGQFADCAVLSRNPLTAAPHELDQINCLATMVDGSFVYGP